MSGWWLGSRRKRQADLEEEIRAHLTMARQDRMDRKETPQQAEENVRREFGNEALIKDVTRDMWGWASLERAAHDIRYGLRVLKKGPGFAAVAVLTLALGIGANAGIFSVINSVLLRPMNYPAPNALVALTRHGPPGRDSPTVTPLKFDFWRTNNHVFRAMAAYNVLATGVNLTGHGQPERLTCLSVSSDSFRVLGVDTYLGRGFTEAEDKPGAGNFTVISYDLWKRLFASDPTMIGRSIILNGSAHVVTGVMPAGFDFPEHAELWTPLQLKIDPADLANDYSVIARMKDGISIKQAKADMDIVGVRLRERFGAGVMDPRESVGVIDLHEWVVGDVRRALLVLMGAVALVLLLTCMNVANLLLARSASRQHEIAVRTALGAGDWRLVRQLLAESLLVAVPGGALGLLLANVSLPLLLRLAPPDLPMLRQVTMDWRVVEFAALLVLASSLLFGLFPALQTLRLSVARTLREAGMRSVTNAGSSSRKVLVVSQVALSLVLLVGRDCSSRPSLS